MIIGIDLGTTNSAVGIWSGERAELIPNALGERLTPSAVGVSDSGGMLVGAAAWERQVTHPLATATAFKRHMGSDREHGLADRSFRTEELSALLLAELRKDAEAFLGEQVTEAVISVPAYFNDTQRRATQQAASLAGLQVERLVNEPTAAALAYGLTEAPDESRFLVFDLGGGTLDVSLLEVFDGVTEVHASAGDNYLGGEDFVDVLVADFLAACGLKPGQLNEREMREVRARMEAAKRELNATEAVDLAIEVAGCLREWRITAERFEQIAAPLMDRVRQPVERALRDGGIRVHDINQVILVGGATRMTMIRRFVAKMFGQLPLRQVDPDELVARGAAVQAGLKARDQALQEVVLTDVSPYSLGVEVSNRSGKTTTDGLFNPIIERNTVVPVSRVDSFTPLNDYQDVLVLRVFQGEARLTRDNVHLGSLRVPLEPAKRSESSVSVRFTYDIDGVLEVEAAVERTGMVHSLVLEQQSGALSREDLERRRARLADLKVHPRDEQVNQAVVARANRIYEELLGDERDYVGGVIAEFLALLEKQDPKVIKRGRKALEEIIEAYENRWTR